MKRFFAMGLAAFLVGAAPRAAAQSSAVDKAEKHLAELLAPGARPPALFATAPVAWRPSPLVEEVALPIQPFVGVPVRLPAAPQKAVKPRAVPEGVPLVSFQGQPVVPKAVELPAKPLIRLPSVDVHQPLPIPILAQPTKERASLGDPAFEASLGAALKPLAPARSQPVPFAPLNLPDPFENLRTGQLRSPPEESAMPPVIPLRRPMK